MKKIVRILLAVTLVLSLTFSAAALTDVWGTVGSGSGWLSGDGQWENYYPNYPYPDYNNPYYYDEDDVYIYDDSDEDDLYVDDSDEDDLYVDDSDDDDFYIDDDGDFNIVVEDPIEALVLEFE